MLTKEERIYGLSKIWRDVKYNFARFSELKELDWDQKYVEFLPQVMYEENPLLYYAKLMQFISLLQDGHSYVTPPTEIMPPYDVPFGTSYVEGRHILTTVPESYAHLLYCEFFSVNGTALDEYINCKLFPYIWHENIKGKFFWGLLGYAISLSEDGTIKIDTSGGPMCVHKSDKVKQITANHGHVEEVSSLAPLYHQDDLLTLYITNDNICLICIPSFADSDMVRVLYSNVDKFKNCRGYIIDVRNNAGGSSRNSNPVAQIFFQSSFCEGEYLTR